MIRIYTFLFATTIFFNCWSGQQNGLELQQFPYQGQLQAQPTYEERCRIARDFIGGLFCTAGLAQMTIGMQTELDSMTTLGYCGLGIFSIVTGNVGSFMVSHADRLEIPLNTSPQERQRLLRINELEKDTGRILKASSFGLGTYAFAGLLPAMKFIPAIKFLLAKWPMKVPALINVLGGSVSMAMPVCCWTRDIKNFITRQCTSQPVEQAEV